MQCYDENLLRQFHSFHLDLTKFFVDHILIRMPQGVFVNEDWLCNCDFVIDGLFNSFLFVEFVQQSKQKERNWEMR